MSFQEVKADRSRRTFLQIVGGGVPTLTLLLRRTGSGNSETTPPRAKTFLEKFTPIDLKRYFNASPTDFGPREEFKRFSGDVAKDGLLRIPSGEQNLRGIPFLLGPEGVRNKSWIVLSTQPGSGATRNLEISLRRQSTFLCLAGFCDWDENETSPTDIDAFEKVGQRLAEATLIYEDGSEKALPIRRRFEVNSPVIFFGHLCFAAEPHLEDNPSQLTDPLNNAMSWGTIQTGVRDGRYPTGPDGRALPIIWVSALANPEPERMIDFLRLRAAAENPLVLCGLTLFHGRENPLRYERLSLYRLTLPEATAEDKERWKLDVDLGVVARTFVLEEFNPESWLATSRKGLGEPAVTVRGARHIYVEVTASREATLRLRGAKAGRDYTFDLGKAAAGRELEAQPTGPQIEILPPEKVSLHGQVVDSVTRQPTPVRLAFRSKEGRYIPPYGHRTEINDAWFQDYGADAKLMGTSFAYVDGSFQIELPVGEVYVEITKGFEYEAVRKKLEIKPGQRELKLEVPRWVDFRRQGWVTADTHVHFLSPTTAVLEGQAEGLNLINLLAAQWGDLYSNVGDLSHGPLISRDGKTIVWLGTENRQHILGHLGLLGTDSDPVYPMSTSGPSEGYLGEPVWSSLADWADACRQREGLVVAAHFPILCGGNCRRHRAWENRRRGTSTPI